MFYTTFLQRLSEELLTSDERTRFRALVTALSVKPLPKDALDKIIAFDDTLDGPSISRLRRVSYAIADRDVFRPFQYCDRSFQMAGGPFEPEWVTRDIVEMSSLHIESLVKRIGNIAGLPLGTAVRDYRVRQMVDARTRSQIERFARVYNSAKHDMSHPAGTHMFSLEDALTAYVTCRKLGVVLYPLISFTTDLRDYDK